MTASGFHLALVFAVAVLTMPGPTLAQPSESVELQQMYEADQAACMPPEGKQIDWQTLNVEDAKRQKRVRQLLAEKRMRSAADFGRAAMILQHGRGADEYLLALDRFLQRIARPQRYATQIEMRYPDPPRLYPVDTTVPDFLRVQFGAPTLATARKREADLIRKVVKAGFPSM